MDVIEKSTVVLITGSALLTAVCALEAMTRKWRTAAAAKARHA